MRSPSLVVFGRELESRSASGSSTGIGDGFRIERFCHDTRFFKEGSGGCSLATATHTREDLQSLI
ncbi:MAG TPA: hypothetical protein VNR64_04980 [Vicinamibacterales bacterium]|nr:hypothetical protein [Vicinamibacterales bacterium]